MEWMRDLFGVHKPIIAMCHLRALPEVLLPHRDPPPQNHPCASECHHHFELCRCHRPAGCDRFPSILGGEGLPSWGERISASTTLAS